MDEQSRSLFGMSFLCYTLCVLSLSSNVDRFLKEIARREIFAWVFAIFIRIAQISTNRRSSALGINATIHLLYFEIGSKNNTQSPKHRKTPWRPDKSMSKPFTRLCRAVARTTTIRMTWCALLQRHQTNTSLETRKHHHTNENCLEISNQRCSFLFRKHELRA